MMEKKLQTIYKSLESLETKMLESEHSMQSLIAGVHPNQVESAKNFLHYLTLRTENIAELQIALHGFGLSSLASSESHILPQLQAVLMRLGKTYPPNTSLANNLHKTNLKEKSAILFGERTTDEPYLMVTIDKSFSFDKEYLQQLMDAGMNIARINCAHDDEQVWEGMINNLRHASRRAGKECKIYMDLAGPKIRTAILGKGKKKGYIKIEEHTEFWLAENEDQIGKGEIVIGCGISGIIPQLKPDHHILFDDGALEARVLEVKDNCARLGLLRNSKSNQKLKAEKGINFPNTDLQIEALTEFDMACLPFICRHADLIGYSFVKTAEDLEHLQNLLKDQPKVPKIILKIETPEAVRNLPKLLTQGMKDDVFGVMIARGDLAVEVGFERMSEIQDEILWFCEAAHVPVIWATQVLETLQKTGIAKRSEITDAAHASMAECVMLNKGDYTLEVIHTLRDILSRNVTHRNKKAYTMKPLNIAKNFFK